MSTPSKSSPRVMAFKASDRHCLPRRRARDGVRRRVSPAVIAEFLDDVVDRHAAAAVA
jgi:hypothetical protein